MACFERVGDGQRDVLAVVANHVVLKRRTAFLGDALETWLRTSSGKIFPMFPRWKMARTPGIFSAAVASMLRMRAVGDRGLDGHGVEQPGEVEIGRVLRLAGDFQRAVDARRLAADGRRRGLSVI